jgi:carbon monoxide dehydrogenase subunit G
VQLEHSFTVPGSPADTWAAFSDVVSVAECFPGAAVTAVEGDSFEGTCKVKLGPIALVYAGSGSFVERDEASGRLVLDATGKDKRGNGTAGAHVTATLVGDGDGTRVDVVTDLRITGKPAQFGRGVIQDVSEKLLQQFVGCLASKMGAPSTDGSSSGDAAAGDAASGNTASRDDRRPPPATDDALDLGATVLPVLARSYWKHALALGVLLLVLWRWLRR